jgi:DNA-binding NtrC family response regulator
VLLVDDDEHVRTLLAKVLEQDGHRVLSAPDGRSAQRLAASAERVDVVVADVNVPGGGGRQLALAVGGFHPHARVVYISGYADEQVAGRGIVAAAPTFLHKPFPPALFVEAVRSVLGEPAHG